MSLPRLADAEKGFYINSKADLWTVNRFTDELKVIALFFGPQYGHFEAIESANRIWKRYFGGSSMPEGLLAQMYDSLKAVADEGVLRGQVPIKRQPSCCYHMGAALFELVAIAMRRRWYSRRHLCPIPFEQPGLIGATLPRGSVPYVPQFLGEGKLIQSYILSY